jgi:hypothetical protein
MVSLLVLSMKRVSLTDAIIDLQNACAKIFPVGIVTGAIGFVAR